MLIPEALLTKTDKGQFQGRSKEIIEKGWDYLKKYFRDTDDYFGFLESLSKDKYEKFLYTIFFYWSHDLFRIIEKKIKDPNILGFMYQITLSMVEYLNENISNQPRERIEDFFTKYFSDSGKIELRNKIIARPINKATLSQMEPWEILYDKRNEFIHRARWFVMRFEGSFASLSKIKRKNGNEYFADIRLHFLEYLRLFWEAYLKYFGRQIDD